MTAHKNFYESSILYFFYKLISNRYNSNLKGDLFYFLLFRILYRRICVVRIYTCKNIGRTKLFNFIVTGFIVFYILQWNSGLKDNNSRKLYYPLKSEFTLTWSLIFWLILFSVFYYHIVLSFHYSVSSLLLSESDLAQYSKYQVLYFLRKL